MSKAMILNPEQKEKQAVGPTILQGQGFIYDVAVTVIELVIAAYSYILHLLRSWVFDLRVCGIGPGIERLWLWLLTINLVSSFLQLFEPNNARMIFLN